MFLLHMLGIFCRRHCVGEQDVADGLQQESTVELPFYANTIATVHAPGHARPHLDL